MRWFTFILVGLLSLPAWALDNLTAQIDRNPVLENESFVLTVTAEGDVDRNAIDFSALLGQFIVGRTQVSTQTQMVNFETTRSTTWVTSLIAPNAGRMTIPPFTVDGKSTQPITVEVIKAGTQAAENMQQEVFIRNTLSSDAVYPGQQAVLTTKLYIGLNLDSANLTEPTAQGVTFTQIGKDQDEMEIVNGKRYRVFQRQYAFSSNHDTSGTIEIKPPYFSGSATSGQRRSLYRLNHSRPISAASEPLSIEIKPIPANGPKPWFVAELVSVESQFETPQDKWLTGEPVTRTITLIAAGTTEEAIPTIQAPYPDSFNQYPDKPQITSGFRGQTHVVKQALSVALIPTQAGEFTLPAVEIPWWNAKTDTLEKAVLPATTIMVEPAAKPAIPQPEFTPELANAPQQVQTEASPLYRYLTWLFAGLWAMTLLGWVIHVKRLTRTTASAQQSVAAPSSSEAQSWNILSTALKTHDPKQVDIALTKWKSDILTSHRDAGILENDALRTALDEMYASRFSTTTSRWNSDKLKAQLTQARQQLQKTSTNTSALKPLYPELK